MDRITIDELRRLLRLLADDRGPDPHLPDLLAMFRRIRPPQSPQDRRSAPDPT